MIFANCRYLLIVSGVITVSSIHTPGPQLLIEIVDVQRASGCQPERYVSTALSISTNAFSNDNYVYHDTIGARIPCS